MKLINGRMYVKLRLTHEQKSQMACVEFIRLQLRSTEDFQISKKKLASVPGAPPGSWVDCCFLFCHSCFWFIRDVKHDISDIQCNASDKNHRWACGKWKGG